MVFTFKGTGAITSSVHVYTGYPQTGDSYARLGAPAGASIAADLATIDGNVDAVLDDTGTSGVVVGSIGSGVITASSIAADAITAAKIADGAIDRATFAADTGLQTVRSGTAQAGASTSVTLDASASATTDYYKHCLIYLTGGTGAGQFRLCTGYNGSTKVATVTPAWATTPTSGTTFAILPAGISNVQAFGGTAGTFTSGRPDVNAAYAGGTAWGSGAITAASIASNAITSAKIAADAIGASQLAADAIGASELAADAATEIAAAVWAATTRVLTAGTNLNDLSASDVRTAVGLSSANLDTQLSAIAGYIDTEVAAIKAKTDNLPSDPADASDVASAISAAQVAILAKVLAYFQLALRKDAAIATDNATELGELNNDEGSGAGAFDNTTDSTEAVRDNQQVAAAAALTAYDPPTKTEMDAGFAALNDLSAAEVNAEVDTALADYDGPTKAELDTAQSSIESAISGLNDPTASAIADAVWDEALSGHTTAGSAGKSLADTETDVTGVLEDTGTTIPAQIAGLNDLSAAEVNAQVDAALADYDAPTKAELDAGLAALNDPSASEIADAVWDEDLTGHTTTDSAGDTLGNVATGTPPTAAAIADAVWEEALSDHSGTAGSTAEALAGASSAGDPWGTSLPGAYSAGTAGYILGTFLDAAISGRASQASLDTVDGIVDAIKAVTDNLPDSGALTTLLGNVAAILTDTGTTLDGKIDALNDLSSSDVVTAVGTALGTYDPPTYTELLNLFRVALRKDSAIATDLAAVLTAINADLASGSGAFSNTTEALEALRDNQQAAAAAAIAAYDPPTNAELSSAVSGLATAAALAVVDGNVDGIKAVTDNLPDSGALTTLLANVAAILADTGTDLPASLATIDGVADAILAMLDDPRGEPGQGAPPVSADLATKVDYLYKLARNKRTQTASTLTVFADDGTTSDHKATVSDDGTTLTVGELGTGA